MSLIIVLGCLLNGRIFLVWVPRAFWGDSVILVGWTKASRYHLPLGRLHEIWYYWR